MQLNQYLNYLKGQSEWAYSIVSQNLINSKGVFVPQAIMDIVGGKANDAMLLADILYWAGINPDTLKPRMSHHMGGHLWIVRTYEEYAEHIRFNSPKTVRNAMHRLAEAGLIVKETHKSPFHRDEDDKEQRALYVRPNWPVLGKALNDWLEAQGKSPETPELGVSENPDLGVSETPKLGDSIYTKSTTESTTKELREISDAISRSPASPSPSLVSGQTEDLDPEKAEFLAAQSLRKAEKYAAKPVSRDSGRSSSKTLTSDELPTICHALAGVVRKYADVSKIKITANQAEELLSRVSIHDKEYDSPQAMYERYGRYSEDWLAEIARTIEEKEKLRFNGGTLVKFVRGYDYRRCGLFEFLARKGKQQPEPIGGYQAEHDRAVRAQIQRRIDAADEVGETRSYVVAMHPISAYEEAEDEIDAVLDPAGNARYTSGQKVGRYQDKAIYEIDGRHFIIVEDRYLEAIDFEGNSND